MKIKTLVGGLEFEPKKDGTPRKQRPVRVSASALSAKQSELEDDHLISYFVWLRALARRFPHVWGERIGDTRGRLAFHVENERLLDPRSTVTRRNKQGQTYRLNLAGMKRKRKGVVRGVPDVLILVPSDGYCYLISDLKVRDADPTPEQLEFMEQARLVGAFGHFTWCWSELARLTLLYFRIDDRAAYLSAGDPRDYLVPQYGGHNERCGCGIKV